MIVWFATGNTHKKKELAGILPAFEIKIPAEAGLAFDPEETGNSFFENALIKAAELHRLLEEKRPSFYKSGDPVIADDSGICVDALGGRPGIHSARYGGMSSGGGKKLSSAEKNILLLEEFAALGGSSPRTARFVCAMVLYFNPNRFFIAQETMEGELVKSFDAARGEGGFGYDPILYIPELGRTVAELSDDEKNIHSHRGKAGKIIDRILAAGTFAKEK